MRWFADHSASRIMVFVSSRICSAKCRNPQFRFKTFSALTSESLRRDEKGYFIAQWIKRSWCASIRNPPRKRGVNDTFTEAKTNLISYPTPPRRISPYTLKTFFYKFKCDVTHGTKVLHIFNSPFYISQKSQKLKKTVHLVLITTSLQIQNAPALFSIKLQIEEKLNFHYIVRYATCSIYTRLLGGGETIHTENQSCKGQTDSQVPPIRSCL